MELNIRAVPISIISAVGTSLLTQFPKHCDKNELKEYNNFFKNLDNNIYINSSDQKRWKKIILKKITWEKCAELNSILCFIEHNKVKEYCIKLISSDTPPAKFSSEIIVEFLQSKGIKTIQQISEGLIYDGTDRFSRRGFPALITHIKLSIDLSLSEGFLPIINATPGFKAETSIMTLMGAIMNTPVFYMHEKMDRPFLLPAMPVSLSQEIWNRWESLVKAVKSKDLTESGTMSAEEFSGYIKQRHLLDGEFLFEEFDNGITLSTLGYIFHEAYGNSKPELKLKKSKTTFENRIAITKLQHHFPKRTMDVAKNIASLYFVESVASKEFRNSSATRVLSRYNNERPGEIFVQWADDTKSVILPVKTTASNEMEHTIARQNIEELLEIDSIDLKKTFQRPGKLFKSKQFQLIYRLADFGEQIVSNASEIESLNKKISKLTELNTILEKKISYEKHKSDQLQTDIDSFAKKSFIEKIKYIFL
jgi:putative CRISPR-associated protein (TIGR02619 family)